MTAVASITADRFNAQALTSPVPVLVDFYADWCPPCQAMGPILDQLKAEIGQAGRIVKVNVEQEPDLARSYAIRSIPTLILFVDGRAVERITGVLSLDALRDMFGNSSAAAPAPAR